MRIKPGNFAVGMWLGSFWLVATLASEKLLGLTGWLRWLYVASLTLAFFFPEKWLEKRMRRTDPELKRSLVRLKLTAGRWAVLLSIAVLWAVEYVVLLSFYRELVTNSRFMPFLLLAVPPMIAITILEAIWIRQDESRNAPASRIGDPKVYGGRLRA